MELEAMRQTPSQEQLALQLIRPAGYYNLKEQRLRNVLNLIAQELKRTGIETLSGPASGAGQPS
jgi:endonuclease III-like uncharacterized protein